MLQSKEKVLGDIKGKIDREIKLIQGFQAVKRNTSNQEVIQRCNTQIRETQSNIDYLQETFDKLQLKVGESQNTVSSGRGEIEGSPRKARVTSIAAPLYSRFDLIKYDCPSLGHKIQYMLQQLQFKLQVENQYRSANEKISHLYLMDGDKSSSSAAEGGKLESDQRIQILNRSLKKYQGMFVDVEEVNRDLEIMNTPKYARKPLTGRLNIQITCIRDVDHIALPMFNKKSESIVSIKIDDVERAKTNGSRNGKFNDDFLLQVEKAHELEITVYDKSGNHRTPVALTWILLSDIAEEIRKKKIANEMGNDVWIPALSIPAQSLNRPPMVPLGNSNFLVHSGPSDDSTDKVKSSVDSTKAILVSAWVNLEPVGQILLNLTFEKDTGESRSAFMGALGRHGAIKQKKEEVFEQHGHQFVQKQFYNIMSCALCGEFLRYSGFQCQDCRLLCHKKCFQKVVTKCISKSGTTFEDEVKFKHRIPHRFEPVLNRGTKWCCHCGYILSWGKKNVRKCSECGVMCHTQCTHLVPDFCGMSMEMANKILMTIKSTNPPKTSVKQKDKDVPPIPSKFSGTQMIPPLQTTPSTDQYSRTEESLSKENAHSHPYHKLQPQSLQAQRFEDEEDSGMKFKLPTKSNKQVQESIDSPYARHPIRSSPHEDDKIADRDLEDQRHDYTFISNKLEDFETGNNPQSKMLADTSTNNPFESSSNVNAFENFNYNDTILPRDVPQVSAQEASSHSRTREGRSSRSKKRRRIGLDDFQFLAVLGKGNFGKVMLAESRQTAKLCAIKVLKKDFIVENEEADSVKSEKRVFLTANKEMHPFLLNLHCCFQTENRIYFVMEYVSGGDLMWHIQKNRFTAKRAKFYACEVLLALKYFHENGIVYRDLKLDNILLTTKGHIKIADYGLCKENMWHRGTTGTFCGTPEFMAPEIIGGKQYERSVDWWAFGVLMFQMLLCQSPFKGDDEDDVFNAIEHDDVRYPISMPRQTVLILQALLTKDPKERLGSGERDALEIMEHQYFLDVNFDDVLNLRIQPPFLPEVTSEHDYSNFDQEFTSETPRLTPVETVLTSEMQEQFRGFSHIADDAPV
ncbi:hypothetical protein METBIDRAFT_37147 [Metschnikowia bicuspidata var. bicuspidata NRRL YB-4993]|uniref:Protein kinase C-like 1 n=1 Tax=Metschnikowia bicuspidata var. bicuspidata NRRL YB-4993 TaxID=869754 RepID=A0A1A0HHA9_9ASCO|nr:hypothetical protein METBIDRAFT_37147 [Metschnikowia bicuspidata var. bicuspidata NRRL YB-4993]OBA23385.1 hypothetical protein METBIDRAFT_37147 [Metschnikowia bicuspidata var. bicuspidata NRRL YB-4993]